MSDNFTESVNKGVEPSAAAQEQAGQSVKKRIDGPKKGSRFTMHLGSIGRLPNQEKINFARHLSITIKSGLPIYESLKIIRKQARSKILQNILDRVIIDVSNGQFLSDSLARHKRVFGDFFINIVAIGERSGTLAANLLYLAEELKKGKELRRKARSAMVYPMVIMFATVGITSLLMFFVFPKVIPIFSSLKVALPLPTRFLIRAVKFSLAYGYYMLGFFVVFVVGVRFFFRLPAAKRALERFFLSTPVLSKLIVDLNVANFTRVLSVLLKSGIQIVEAVRITSQTFSNMMYREAISKASEHIRTGEQLASYLGKERKLFPGLMVSMIEIGENTGNLQSNLEYLSEYFTDEADSSLKNLTTLLEPLLLLLMALIVLFIALSIIMPIYSITQNLQNLQ